MPRGSSPNSRKNLIKGKPFCEETAREAARKKHEIESAIKPLRELLKEQCTDEDRRQMNAFLIRMAKRNLHAYELLMKALGEDPAKKVEMSGANGGPLEFVWAGDNE